jgi:hypothetical protein
MGIFYFGLSTKRLAKEPNKSRKKNKNFHGELTKFKSKGIKINSRLLAK